MALAASFRRIDYFCQGRLSTEAHAQRGSLDPHQTLLLRPTNPADDPNEDRLWARTYPAYGHVTGLLAADGVTQRTPWRVNGRPAGAHAVDILVARVDIRLGPGLSAQELWADIQQHQLDFERLHGCPAEEKLRATAAIFNPFMADDDHCGEIWEIGDVLHGHERADGSWAPSIQTLPPNGPDAITRADAIRAAMQRGYHPPPVENPLDIDSWGEIVEHPHRLTPTQLQAWRRELYALGWEALQAGRRQRQLGLAPPEAVGNTMTPAAWDAGFRCTKVPRGVRRIMLGSDGPQLPCRSIAEGLHRLHQWSRFDPMVLGIPPTDPTVRAAFLPYLHVVDGQPQWPRHTKGFIDAEGVARPLLDDTTIVIAELAEA